MIDAQELRGIQLPGGFVIAEVEFTSEPLLDPLGREATARTRIIGRTFHLVICSRIRADELSVTLYHEILEAATVASRHPPEGVVDLNEEGFERAARAAHLTLGQASGENLARMLRFHGFRAH